MQDEKQRFVKKRALAKRLDEDARKEQEFYVSKCLFKAVIYRRLVDIKKAEQWYREAVMTDTTKIDNLFILARFLQDQNRPIEPERWYKRILALNPPESFLANTLGEMAIFYQVNKRLIEAEQTYQQVHQIFQNLAQKDTNRYEPDLATTLNNMGTFYKATNRPLEAEKAYQEAQQIWERWVQKNPDYYEPALANTLDNLGSL